MLPGSGTAIRGTPPPYVLGSELHDRMPDSSASVFYYVNSSIGSDSRSATEAQSPLTPWQSINKAVSTVTTPGAVISCEGTFQSVGGSYACLISGRVIAGAGANPITIRASSPGLATITGSAMGGVFTVGAFIVNSVGWRIQDFRFSVQGLRSVGVQIENTNWAELEGCTFVDTGEIAVKTRGAPGTPSTDIGVWNCLFAPSGTKTWQRTGSQWVGDPTSTEFCAGLDTGNGPGGDTGYYGTRGSHCMYMGQVSGAETGQGGSLRNTVANCVFTGATPGRHIELGPQAVESHIVNNTFYGNEPGFYTNSDDPSYNSGLAGTGVEFFGNVSAYATRNNRVYNNIFSELQGHACYGSAGFNLTGNLVANNLAYSLTNGGGWQESTSLDYHTTWGSSTLFTNGGNVTSADPQFTSPSKNEAGNFHISGGSPAVGAAAPDWCPPLDRDGVTRPATPALGAYEP